MTRKSVHQITMSRAELAALQEKDRRMSPLATPLTPEQLQAAQDKYREEMQRIIAGEGPKQRREMKRIEQTAQRKLYQEHLPTAMHDEPELAWQLDLVYAIPNFNANYADPKLQRIAQAQGSRLKLEGMRRGMPDNHVPVPSLGFASLYLELKGESYPSDDQRILFPKLARAGNAVVTLKFADAALLAETAMEVIMGYLTGDDGFYIHGHPKFTYVHRTTHSLADLDP